MKIDQATAPPIEEFKRVCAEEFSFVRSFGFHEAPPLPTRYQNPFEFHLEKDGWRMVIEGLSYGFAADISIRSPDGRRASLGHLVSKDKWLAQRQRFERGQLGDLKNLAICLRSFGQAFLAGDWSAFDQLIKKQDEWISKNRRAQESEQRDREMDKAIRDAAVAFRDGRYNETVEKLAAFEGTLPPAQAKKLAIARKKSVPS